MSGRGANFTRITLRGTCSECFDSHCIPIYPALAAQNMNDHTSRITHHSSPPFYIVGGTLPRDAPSYVERQADRDLSDGLTLGKFCYVLTSRQLGKSSLMVRTAARLREEGAAVAVLDLTAIGQNLNLKQWYGSLLSQLGQQLGLEDELIEYWQRPPAFVSPLRQWTEAIRQVILMHCLDRVVIFIDEIDAVRSLPFSTDEFFAGLRELYNRRSIDKELLRLTFCLLGVATPSDLIRETRTTPFNIGQRIELRDFTEAEAVPLACGLGREGELGTTLLKRILYWTGGHPYLTQRLCQRVAEDSGVNEEPGVDRLCVDLFMSQQAREMDDNLLFVRERILRSEADLTGLLEMYEMICRNRRVRNDETNPLVSILLLSGIARSLDDYLIVRNRIYRRVFDRAWVRANLPDAEVRRQQVAYRRGLLRAAGIAAIMLLIISSLAIIALVEYRQANAQRRIAEAQERSNSGLLYTAQMTLAQQAWESAHVGRVLELLEAQRPKAGEEDLRGFEWYYLWRLTHRDSFTLQHSGRVASVAFSPDGKVLATGSEDQTVKLWDVASGQELATLQGHTDVVSSVSFSPDGTILATASGDRTVKLWDVAGRRELATFTGHQNAIRSLAFSPDGKILATGSEEGTVKLWDVHLRKELLTFDDHTGPVHSVSFSPDGKTIATGSKYALKLWDVATGNELPPFAEPKGDVYSVAFSHDGRMLAETRDDVAVLWNVSTRRKLATFQGHTGKVNALMFSPDGEILATAGQDETVKLWKVVSGQEITTIKGHADAVRSVAFSPDGKRLATGSDDRTAKLWSVTQKQEESITLKGHTDQIHSMAFSPDGKVLATGSNDMTARLWSVAGGDELATLRGHHGACLVVAFSSDGKILATGSEDQTIKLWDVASAHELATLYGHKYGVRTLAFSPDGKTLATEGGDRTIKLWDVTGRREMTTITGLMDAIDSMAFSNDGKVLATGHEMAVKLWDVTKGQEIAVSKEHADLIRSVQRPGLRSGASFTVGTLDQEVNWYIADVPVGGTIRPTSQRTSVARSLGWHHFLIKINPEGYRVLIDDTTVASGTGDFDFTEVKLKINAPEWRPDAKYYFDDFCYTPAATGQSFCDGFEGKVLDQFWTVQQEYGKVTLTTAKSHSGGQSVELSTISGGKREIWMSHQFGFAMKGAVSVWFYDTAPGAETLYAYLQLENKAVQSHAAAALSPDGKTLVMGGDDDQTVKVWDVSSGKEIAVLHGHAGPVHCLGFSPDGKRLVTGSEDRTIKLWDVVTWQEVGTLKGHADTVMSVQFSPDGKNLATMSNDHVVKIWQAMTSK